MKGVLRAALFACAMIAVAIGAVWVLQGAGLIPIRRMAHQPPWIYLGTMLAFAGVVLALISRSMRKRPAPPPADASARDPSGLAK